MLLVSAIHSDPMPKFARSLAPLISTAIAVPSSTWTTCGEHSMTNGDENYASVTSSDRIKMEQNLCEWKEKG